MYKRLLSLAAVMLLSVPCVYAQPVSADEKTASAVMECFQQEGGKDAAALCVEKQLGLKESTLVLFVQIDMPVATSVWLNEMSKKVQTVLQKNQVVYEHINVSGDNLTLDLPNAQALRQAQKVIKDLEIPLVRANNPAAYQLEMDAQALRHFQEGIAQRYIKKVNYRLHQLGISNATFLPSRDDRVILLIPGVTKQSQEKVFNQLNAVSTLQFHVVDDGVASKAVLAGDAPVSANMLLLKESNGNPVLVSRDALAVQDHLQNVSVLLDQREQKAIAVTFDAKGAELFYELTRQNIAKRLAIVFTDSSVSEPKVLSAPVVMEPISGGRVMISGAFTDPEDLQRVVDGLEASMPLPSVSILNECIVKPKP